MPFVNLMAHITGPRQKLSHNHGTIGSRRLCYIYSSSLFESMLGVLHAGVVLQALLTVKSNPAWSAMILAITKGWRSARIGSAKQGPRITSWQELQQHHALDAGLMAAAKEVYLEWLVSICPLRLPILALT